MAETEIPRRAGHAPAGMYVLSAGTLVAAALAVLVAQVGFAIGEGVAVPDAGRRVVDGTRVLVPRIGPDL